ncbi:MAG: DUF1963 domain-containing protein [Planctomycetes bacterium]|nr:DUF1963 domain-containing protein [Planctomycetota bacterium]
MAEALADQEKRIRGMLAGRGLGPFVGAILDLCRPALRVTPFARAGGASRFGGLPDRCAGQPWPHWKERPLAFLAQIQLAELPRGPFFPPLPGTGLVQFFYDQDQSTWGFDPGDRGSWCIRFSPDPGSGAREEAPGRLDVRVNERGMEFEPILTAPHPGSDWLRNLNLDEAAREAYHRCYFDDITETWPHTGHRLGGHASEIQNPMEVECQFASNGIDCGGTKATDPAQRDRLLPGWRDWALLFQMDSDDDLGVMWGDVGMLYFWIRREDLAAARFEASWLVLQCC